MSAAVAEFTSVHWLRFVAPNAPRAPRPRRSAAPTAHRPPPTAHRPPPLSFYTPHAAAHLPAILS
ncbi:hypothetical protein J7E97_31520, partial [Streptomyces sp. ISL-66]|nr:hypothetical protein [Streptomyces sp. ISL-66]